MTCVLIFLLVSLIIGIAFSLTFHCPDDYDAYQIGPDPHPDDRQLYCSHPETYIKVLEEIVNCEKTVVACRNCGKHLTEPETDCR